MAKYEKELDVFHVSKMAIRKIVPSLLVLADGELSDFILEVGEEFININIL